MKGSGWGSPLAHTKGEVEGSGWGDLQAHTRGRQELRGLTWGGFQAHIRDEVEGSGQGGLQANTQGCPDPYSEGASPVPTPGGCPGPGPDMFDVYPSIAV